LQHAVSVELGGEDVEDEPLEVVDLIVSVCKGLVTVDAESRSFRLVHFTVEEFFKNNHYKWFPDADKLLAKICITYLSFDAFGRAICSNESEWDARSQKYVLVQYAAQNWMAHVGQADLVLQEAQPVVLRFLGDELKVAAAEQAFHLNDGFDFFINDTLHRRSTGIHLVVRMKSLELDAYTKIVGDRIAVQNSGNSTHLTMMRWLIGSGAGVNDSTSYGSTALMIAAKCGWVDSVKLLLDQGADPHAVDCKKSTCLHRVADRLRAIGRARSAKVLISS
jgi:Ankyrin repeats (3 copies)